MFDLVSEDLSGHVDSFELDPKGIRRLAEFGQGWSAKQRGAECGEGRAKTLHQFPQRRHALRGTLFREIEFDGVFGERTWQGAQAESSLALARTPPDEAPRRSEKQIDRHPVSRRIAGALAKLDVRARPQLAGHQCLLSYPRSLDSPSTSRVEFDDPPHAAIEIIIRQESDDRPEFSLPPHDASWTSRQAASHRSDGRPRPRACCAAA